MAREHTCTACEFAGKAKLGAVGIALWFVVGLLFIFSWLFWPLFLIWPFVALGLIFTPIGRVCPECGGKVKGAGG